MTLIRRMTSATSERNAGALENPAVPLTSATLLTWFGAPKTDAGVPVTETSSLAMPAVWRCVSLISSVCAALPLQAYRTGSHERVSAPLLEDPHPELTAYELWKLTYVHRCLWGNAYLQKKRDGGGIVRELWPMTPDRVQVTRVASSEVNPSGKLFKFTDDWGNVHPLTSYDVMHIPALGYDGITGCSPIRAAQQGIGLSIAAEKSGAKFFGSGNMMGGILQTEQRLDKDQAEALKERWQSKIAGVHNAHEVAILDSGASFQPIGISNRDAQFLESRSFQIGEISRMFGVPMYLLSETDKSTSWGTGLEQQAQGFVTFDLHPMWLKPTEARITKELLSSSRYAEYNVEGILRGDSQARAEFYRAMREIGAYSANDIREKENMPPVEGGDTYLQPLNMAPLGTTPEPPTQDNGGAPTDPSLNNDGAANDPNQP